MKHAEYILIIQALDLALVLYTNKQVDTPAMYPVWLYFYHNYYAIAASASYLSCFIGNWFVEMKLARCEKWRYLNSHALIFYISGRQSRTR